MPNAFWQLADGVGLNHCAHEAEREDDSDCEEACHEFAEGVIEGFLNIVNRGRRRRFRRD